MEIIERPPEQKGFQVPPHRWVVERSFAWRTNNREVVRDDWYDLRSSEGWVYLASIRVMLQRLEKVPDDLLLCSSHERHTL